MAKSKKHSKPSSKNPRRHEQTFIPGTEPKEIPKVLRDAVHKWLDDVDEAKQVARRKKMSHDVMVARALELGIERAPYVDSVSGKKKHVYFDRTPHAKTINAPRTEKQRRKAEDRDRPDIEAEITDPNADKAESVESRRVPRATVAEEIGEADGFKDLRARMAETEH